MIEFKFTEEQMIIALEANGYHLTYGEMGFVPPGWDGTKSYLDLQEAFVHLLKARNIL